MVKHFHFWKKKKNPMYRCKAGAAWVWVRQVLASKHEELQEIRENKASSLRASLRSSVGSPLVGGGGNLRKDSWQDGSQNKAERAVWYQHFSAWVWRNPAGRCEVISPGSMCSTVGTTGPANPGKPQKHCGKPGACFLMQPLSPNGKFASCFIQ